MSLCNLAGIFYLLGCSVGIAPAQVILNRARKQQIDLEHHGNGIAQIFKRVVRNGSAANLDNAFGYIIKAGNHLHKRGFGRAGAADNSYCFTRFNVKIYIVDNILFARLFVFEADIFHIDIAVFNFKRGVCVGVADFGRFFKNFNNTHQRGTRHNSHNENHGYHHKRHQNLIDICYECRQLARFHCAADDKLSAEPQNGYYAAINRKLHKGICNNEKFFSGDGSVFQIVVGNLEFFFFVGGADKCFDYSHSDKVFLNRGVQRVNL